MLQVKNITFSYAKEKTINKINFNLEKGKTIAIIGESGCGKSTLLKLIYGLEDLDEGTIFWNEAQILGPKFHLVPGMDFMKYLAQDFDLMPFTTVSENIGKFLSNVNLEKKQQRIDELLVVVEMTEFSKIKVKNLSGGQMQRVALARVLARNPEVLLLDEPFSHIDNFRKNSLRRKIFSYLKQNQITTLIATHDSTDILSFSDQVMVMKKGSSIEINSPLEIYNSPKNQYTASLFSEVNQISALFFDSKIDEVVLVYPHQLQIVSKSNLLVQIQKNYFRGTHYLVETLHETNIIYFENHEPIKENELVYINLKSNN